MSCISTTCTVKVNGKNTRVSTWNDTFNLTPQRKSNSPWKTTIGYSGNNCSITANTAYHNGMKTYAKATKITELNGNDYHYTPFDNSKNIKDWRTTEVQRGKSATKFTIKTPQGFTGLIGLKTTSCTTGGGTRDASTTPLSNGTTACICTGDGNKNNTIKVVAKSGNKVLYNKNSVIEPNVHHMNITIPITTPTNGNIVLEVSSLDGTDTAVHAQGTHAIGTYR